MLVRARSVEAGPLVVSDSERKAELERGGRGGGNERQRQENQSAGRIEDPCYWDSAVFTETLLCGSSSRASAGWGARRTAATRKWVPPAILTLIIVGDRGEPDRPGSFQGLEAGDAVKKLQCCDIRIRRWERGTFWTGILIPISRSAGKARPKDTGRRRRGEIRGAGGSSGGPSDATFKDRSGIGQDEVFTAVGPRRRWSDGKLGGAMHAPCVPLLPLREAWTAGGRWGPNAKVDDPSQRSKEI